ncbi:MAG: hypothetical protein AB1401_04675 [Thermodesulfobacteriota bacterium]
MCFRVISSFLILFLFLNALIFAEEWKTYKTSYSTIFYRTEEDLFKLDYKLDVNFIDSKYQGFFSHFLYRKRREFLYPRLKVKVDAILTRVQLLLDIYISDPHIDVYAYPDRKELDNAYYYLYGKRAPSIAYYEHETKSIYLSVKDVSEGVLAHEMAHYVISNYFVIVLPLKTQDVLAQYVDQHLID